MTSTDRSKNKPIIDSIEQDGKLLKTNWLFWNLYLLRIF